MGRKGVVPGYKIIDSGDLSGDITSNISNVINQDVGSIHLSWTGTSPVGTITVEARNGSADSWYTLDMGSTISISGNSGDHQLVFNELPFYDIRIQYTRGSGTGTLDAYFVSKVVGA